VLLVPLNGEHSLTTLSTPATGMVRPLTFAATSGTIGRRQLAVVTARIA